MKRKLVIPLMALGIAAAVSGCCNCAGSAGDCDEVMTMEAVEIVPCNAPGTPAQKKAPAKRINMHTPDCAHMQNCKTTACNTTGSTGSTGNSGSTGNNTAAQ